MTLLTLTLLVSLSEANLGADWRLSLFMFFIPLSMTSSIPNSFSSDDLQAMLDSAPKEEEMHAPAETESGLTSDEEALDELADEILNSVPEEYQGPLIHKVMTMKVIARMIEWHTHMGERLMEEGETETGTAWLRDAGKFQAAFGILQTITVGKDDFTVPAE